MARLLAADWVRRSFILGTIIVMVLVALRVPTSFAMPADPTPPTISFVGWTETSPYAHYNAGNDLDRLWFNPNYSDSVTAEVLASDPESGIQYIEWPNPPLWWTPAASNDPSMTRTYTWNAGDAGGVVNIRARHNATSPPSADFSSPVTMEFVADNTPPNNTALPTAFRIQNPVWANTAANRVYFPGAGSFSDPGGSSATGVGPITRLLQRRDGVADGTGGCDVSAGSWVTVATNPTGTDINNTPAVNISVPGQCTEFRYRIEDAVGNATHMYADGFRGWDNDMPSSGTVTSIVEGAGPLYQKVELPNTVFYNPAYSGDFTVHATASDPSSGVARMSFQGAAGFTPSGWAPVFAPDPWEMVYSWNSGATHHGQRALWVYDYANNNLYNNQFSILRDVTGPGAGSATLDYYTGTWRNTPEVTITMAGLMSDGAGSGVASYQLQRDEVAYIPGTGCGTYPDIYGQNIGAPVYGDPPPALPVISDSTVVSGMCYRYRIEATDQVQNIGYRSYLHVNQNSYSVVVDDVDPTGSFDPITTPNSGNITFSGTIADALSGLANPAAQAVVRLEPLVPAGPTITLGTDTSVTSGTWALPAWNSTAYNGSFRLHLDLTDRAGNEKLSADTFDIVLDNTIPTLAFAGFADGTNPQYSHFDAPPSSQAWVRSNAGASGSLFAQFTPDDPDTGIAYITVPTSTNTGWSPPANSQVMAPGPWQQELSWTSGAANLGTRNATATSNSGKTSANEPFTVTVDNTVPANPADLVVNNHGPGGLPGVGGWHIEPTLDINVTSMTDAASDMKVQQLERDEFEPSVPGGICGTADFPNTWTTVVGTAAPTLPAVITDTTIQNNHCYRYRLHGWDNVTNEYIDTVSAIVRVDFDMPTGSFNALPSFASSPPNMIVSWTVNDATSGIPTPPAPYNIGASRRLQVNMQPIDGVGTPTGPEFVVYTATGDFETTNTWSFDTSSYNGRYRMTLDVRDRAGQEVTGLTPHDILFDNTPPTMTFDGFTAGTNPACQHIDPLDDTKAWVRSDSTPTSCDGSIFANFTPDDPESGIDHITVPTAGPSAGWTIPGGATVLAAPWRQELVWANAAGAIGTAHTRLGRATSKAGKNSPDEPFTVVVDNTNPVGGTVSPTVVNTIGNANWHILDDLTISLTSATDASSGIKNQWVERMEKPRPVGGNCGTNPWPGLLDPGYWTPISVPALTLPATFVDTTMASGVCYLYRVAALDNVGNLYESAVSPTIIRDNTAPTGAINATPLSPWKGNLTGATAIRGSKNDGPSGPNQAISRATIRWENLGDLTTGTIGQTALDGNLTWAIAFNTAAGATPDGNYRIWVDLEDQIGNIRTGTIGNGQYRDVVIDNSPPTIDLVSVTPTTQPQCQYWDGLPSQTHYVNRLAASGCSSGEFKVLVNADDPPGGLNSVRFYDNGGIYPIVSGMGNDHDVLAAPWESEYHYMSTIGLLVRTADVQARGNSGTNTAITMKYVLDMVGPSGLTFTGPGGTTSPSYWSNATTVNVPYTISDVVDPPVTSEPGSGVRPGTHVVSRRESTSASCATWSVWTTISSPGAASPYPDGSVADGTCYQYRVRFEDRVNNSTWFTDTTNQIRIDRQPPTGLFTTPVAPYVKGTSVALGGTDADNWSGVASLSVRIGAGPLMACNPTAVPTWSCNWDTTATPDGPTTLTLVVTDRAGNSVDADTVSTFVDNTAPTGTVTLAKGTNPQWQHLVSGPTPLMWVNTNQASGDFTASVNSDDGTGSGILDTSFPALGVNWTPAAPTVDPVAPYSVTYGWTSTSAVDPGAQNVQIQDNALNQVTAPFEVRADKNAPTGVSIAYDGGPTSVPSITFASGTDADSGLATWRIERDETNVSGPGTCDPFPNTWTGVATDPATSPWTDATVVMGKCYRYRIVSVDNVGNDVTVNDPESDVITVEPAGIVITESGTGPSTDVAEGGATDTYTVRLRTKPAGSVTVTIGTPDGQVSVSPATLTFTSTDWGTDQTVTVTAVQDDVDEVPDPHTGQITHVAASAGDLDYDGLTGADVIANITDDDVSGVTFSADSTSVSVAEAGETTDTYTVVLDSKPTGNVVLDLASDAQTTVSPAQITFTPANWNSAVTVTIKAVNDDFDESNPHNSTITHTINTGLTADPLYNALPPLADVTASVADNDTVGVTVNPTSGLTLDEADLPTTVQYSIVLDSMPLGDVIVNISGDADGTPSPTLLTFSQANWNIPQYVAVSVTDDTIVEGAHTTTMSHVVSSIADSAYNSAAAAPVVIDILDDDVPGIEVAPLGPLAADEGGPAVTYQIRLKSEPLGNVDISFNTGSEIDPITTLTFTPVNWATFQDVNVVATDDDIDEIPMPTHLGTIVHTVTSPMDSNYDAWALADMLVDITDNDTAGVTIDELGGLSIAELGATSDTFTVKLDSEPTAPITVAINSDAQTTNSGPLTFTPANWMNPQVVTVTAVDDGVDEADPHPGLISFTVSGDTKYDAVTVPAITAQIADDDTASVLITPGTPTLAETGTTSATYDIELGSQPATNVIVNITPDAQVTTSLSQVTFTNANWNTPQTITVTAVDDPTVEDPTHPGQVTHAVDPTSDASYLLVSAAPKDVDITDNDSPGITVNEGPGVEATEGGTDGTYTIVLDRQPRVGETVTVDIAGDSQATPNPTQLVFTHANWSNPQTVTVTATDDSIQEADPHASAMTHTVSSTDILWGSITTLANVDVDVHDNDVAALEITHASPYSLSENTPAATVTYSVKLKTQPSADVTFTLAVPSDLQADVSLLTFNSVNWATAQTVTVNAVDDIIAEETPPIHIRTITHTTTSTDPFYSVLDLDDMVFNVEDNDIPGIGISKSTLAAAEGGATDTFVISMNTQPAYDVTIDLTGTEVGFDIDPVTFTSTNWATAQTITVNAIDDDVDELLEPHAGLVEFAVNSADNIYNNWTLADIPVDVSDNDDAGVIIAPGVGTPISIDESIAGGAQYSIVLNSQPLDDVTITLGTLPAGQITTSVPSVTFTPGDWSTPQFVTVDTIPDDIDEGATYNVDVTHVASSATDPRYIGAMPIDNQPVEVTDDDTASVTITPTVITLDEANVAATATFDVVLGSEPTADVKVQLDTSDLQTTTDVPDLTFTSGNWSSPQTVTVTVVNDDIDEANPHNGVIATTVNSTDPGYSALDPDDVTASITDDDTAGVDLVEVSGTTDVDESGSLTDTYEIKLKSQPIADVTITIGGGPQASTNPALLTFTPTNWNAVQVVTVTGTADHIVEGPHTQTFTHVATSADPIYNAISIPNVIANITDDNVAGATITPSTTLVVDEDGTLTPTYDVVLDAQPASDVTIAVAPDAQLDTNGVTSLTFTSLNWQIPQTITVTAVDDSITEPSPHAGTITHTMTSGDTNFNNVPVSSVTADITDNDDPGVTITPTTLSIPEAGPGTTFDVVLDSVPTADVTVDFTTDSQLQSIPSITFTPATWNTVQQVTVTAVIDDIQEADPHTSTITIDTTSSATGYGTGALTIDDVVVSIDDDDTAGVLIVPLGSLSGSEGDVVQYQMSLTSEPPANIEITLAGDADGTLAQTVYTFTPSNWSTPQNVDVTLVQDQIAEGAHSTKITGMITNNAGDPFYTAVVVSDQDIAITDDDSAGLSFTPNTPGPLAISEDGLVTATYDIELTSEPTGDVEVSLLALAGQATASPAMLTFTSSNWASTQTVTITAVQDDYDEANPHTDTMNHIMGGADPVYAALTPPGMDLDIADDDTAGVEINVTGADTAVAEGGATDTVEVVLKSKPLGDVVVTLTGTQVSLSASPLTFSDTNWNVPQTVTVAAIDDDIDEGNPHSGSIDALTASLADPAYSGLVATPHPVTITENDVAGVVITQPVVDQLDEADAVTGQIYKVRLKSEPTAPVDVTIMPDAQVSAAPLTLSFTPANWFVDQDVMVNPINDLVAEANPHPGVLAHDTVTGLDPKYDAGALTIDPVVFQIADNDFPAILISQTAGHLVTEGGATASYDIVLGSQPTADVTLTPVSTQLEWSVPSITFTAGDWNVAQTVTLQAIDDFVQEANPHPGALDMTITSADGGYTALTPDTVTADITDNDTSDLVLTPSSGLAVAEDGSLGNAQYTLTLTSIPAGPVDVTLTADAQVQVTPAIVQLDAGNWNTGVTVDVSAVDDQTQEVSPHTGIITHAMSSPLDPNFDGETGPSQTIDVTDDDTALVVITPTGADTTVDEDKTIPDTYDVVLDTIPTADVTITVSPDAQVTTNPATLTFTPANWNVVQSVTVEGVDDPIIEAATHAGVISHTIASADGFYAALSVPPVNVNVIDNDYADVIVTPAGGTFEIAEGGTTDDLTFTLNSLPASPVTLNLSTPDGQSTLSQSSVVLDALNWNTGVTITVTAVDDGFIENPHPAAHVVVAVDPSSDPDYVAMTPIPDVLAQVTDNDSASVIVDELGGVELDEADSATTDTFEVKLGASPNVGETVDVAIGSDPVQLSVAPTPLTFDSTNWNVVQTVTVTVNDDQIDEPEPHTSAITFATTSGDANFNGLVTASIDATIHDNDDAGIVLDKNTASIAEAGATSDTVNVQLKSQPMGTVEVALSYDAAQVSVVPAGPLVFDSTNWNIDQAVTITAVDDKIDEDDPHDSLVSLDATSIAAADPGYDLLANSDVTASIADDDTSDIDVVLASGVDLDEANLAQTMVYDVTLKSQPTADVTLTWTPDAQVSVLTGGSMTFNASNWMNAQQVTVTAVNDDVDEADPHTGLLAVTLASGDSKYAALAPMPQSIDVHDNDTAGVIITQGTVPEPISEGGATVTYSVMLSSEPTSNVDITLTPDSQVNTGGVTTLTFTPANWNVPQSVTVEAVNDTVTEPTTHPGKVSHSSDSLDANYAIAAGLVIADADFAITDDDVAGFTITGVPPNPSVNEAGATSATYQINIDTTPLTDVVLDLTATKGQATVSPATITFAGGASPAAQTITVTAIDDPLVEGAHDDLITHIVNAAASDDNYDLITAADVTVDVADNDNATLDVTNLSANTLDEADTATKQTFDLTLGGQPTSDVTVTVGTTDGQTSVTNSSYTFTNANWNVAQQVEVSVVDDHTIETSPHTGLVTFTTSSAHLAFDALTTAPASFDITDNDSAGFTIVDASPNTMDEADVAGTERSLTVMLTSQPAVGDQVVVNAATPANQLGIQTMPTLTFDNTNWNIAQTVTVRAVDDAIVESTPHTGTLSLAIDPLTSDTNYSSVTISDRSFDITDNDPPSVVFTPSLPGPIAVSEDGSVTATYDIVLGAEPVSAVTIDLAAASGQVSVTPATLTFVPGNWSSAQTVTVTGVQDQIFEGAHVDQITHTMGGDAAWLSYVAGPMDVNITDDDNAGVTITQSPKPQLLDEGNVAGTVTYDVVLNSQPTSDVTVTLAPDAQVAVTSPTTLTFTPGDWNSAQTVTVEVVDDITTESSPHTGTIVHTTDSVSDPAYAAAAALVIDNAEFSITDNDNPGLAVTPLDPAVGVDEEGATSATYTIATTSTPSVDVTINLSSGPNVTVTPASITFAGGSAPAPQTVTVTAVDDGLVEANPHTDTVTHTITSTDPGWAALTIADLSIDIADNDTASVDIDVADGLNIDEAGQTTDTFTVVLGAQPTADVDVAVSFDSAQLESPTPANLTFTNANWNVPQTVTIKPVDDSIVEGAHTSTLQFASSSTDANFNSLTIADQLVNIADNDSAGVKVSAPVPAAGNLAEADTAGSAKTVTVTLDSQPVGTVTVTGTHNGQVSLSANPLLFDASNWQSGIPVTITALNDSVAEVNPHPATIDFAVTDAPADTPYAGLSAPTTTLQVDDDDTAGIMCQPGSDWVVDGAGRLQMSEDPAAADNTVECAIQLNSEAAQDVVVTASTNPATSLGVAPASVTIPAGSSGPATFTFTAADDALAQGLHSAQISFAITSTDPLYSALTLPTVDVDIADNDAVGVTVTPAGPITLAEGGSAEQVTVALQSEPTAQVEITLLPDSQVSATPLTLTFLPSNWNTPQTVAVSAVDDAIDEPDGHSGLMAFTLASTDASYAALAPAPIFFAITDNDSASVIVTPTDGSNAVAEGGASDKLSVVLGTLPIDNVTVAVTGDSQVSTAPASLVFTPSNWNVPQNVTLTAVQDVVVEGNHTGNVTFALTSNDIAYMAGSASTPGAQSVAITDDDVAGIKIVQSEGTTLLSEAGQTDTYTVQLTNQPLADVTVTPNGGTQVTAAPAALIFTPANWNTPQMVTLTAVQDAIDEPDPHPGEVKHTLTTTAPGWADIQVPSVMAQITDDDEVGIVVGQSDDSTKVIEGAKEGDTITFRLTSQPESDVSIIAKPDSQLSVEDKPIILKPNSWRDPITLRVNAVDDEDYEGDHEGVLTFEVSTKDKGYEKATIGPIVVGITDNERDTGIDEEVIGGEGEGEGERGPREVVPPAKTRNQAKNPNKARNNDRRSNSGSKRTNSGRTRLPYGTTNGLTDRETGERKGKRLGGEVVAAKKDEVKPKNTFIKDAIDWLRKNWLLIVAGVLGAAAIGGSALYYLRNDPVKSAQRAAKNGQSGRLAAGGRRRKKDDDLLDKNRKNARARKKKKRKDDEKNQK